ncbi:MAG: hypothetical protein ACYS74_04960 [Planctomycetota bacterium]|jgi:hypothetical protein
MDNEETKELCMNLLKADSEDEVVSLLKEKGYWDNPDLWRFYGDNPNNRGTAGAQQAHSDAALVEKLVNSIDARLMNEALVRGIDPTGPDAPSTIREAVIRFYDEGADVESSVAGRLSSWSEPKIRETSKGIAICATGSKAKEGEPCFTISDSGEGQTPEMFPDTLLTLSKSNKKDIPFVQGTFSMGGTGVLRFCGDRKLQLILSRRNPAILGAHRAFCSDSQWGFTIVRRNSAVDRGAAFYEYLAPVPSDRKDGTKGVLRYSADSMPIFPEGNSAYTRHSKWGTVVKLYEYSCVGFGKSSLHRKDGLTNRLQLRLPKPALPIRSYECRAYGGRSGSYEYSVTGLVHRIEESRKVEENLEATIDFTIFVDNEVVIVTVYVFKKNRSEAFKKNEGVLFTFNGQTQGHLTEGFFGTKEVGLSYLKESLLVLVDCSSLSPIAQDELFMSNRFILAKSKFTEKIKRALGEELHDNQTLRELKNKRREEQLASKLEDQRPLEDVLRRILQKNRVLASVFALGSRLSNPFKVKQVGSADVPFKGKRFPEYFKFKGQNVGYELRKNCHKNMRFQLTFETDAENEYFRREIEPGELKLFLLQNGSRTRVDNWAGPALRNGIANLRVSLPSDCSIGDKLRYCSVVTDASRIEPIENYCTITVEHSAPIGGRNGGRRKPPTKDPGTDRELLGGISFPEIKYVSRDEWGNYTPIFNDYTALRIVDTGESHDDVDNTKRSIYDFYVNIDNIYFQSEAKISKKNPKVLQKQFEVGLVLVGLALLQQSARTEPQRVQLEESESLTSNGDGIEAKVELFTTAIAPILLPMIDELGVLTEEELETPGDSGEDV